MSRDEPAARPAARPAAQRSRSRVIRRDDAGRAWLDGFCRGCGGPARIEDRSAPTLGVMRLEAHVDHEGWCPPDRRRRAQLELTDLLNSAHTQAHLARAER